MFGIGVLYRDGWGVKKDSEAAARWFNVAAGKILTMRNDKLTEEEIDQSIQILTKINEKHPGMLGG